MKSKKIIDERDLGRRDHLPPNDDDGGQIEVRAKDPIRAAIVTFVAALIAAAIPLIPFAFLSLQRAMVVSALLSVSALFLLGGWKGGVTARSWWRDGLQFVAIGSVAALASALIGIALRTSG